MQGIRVRQAYSGRLTRGATVEPGSYLVDDPRVFGPAAVDAMLLKGFAERIELDAPAVAEDVVDAPIEDDGWELDDAPEESSAEETAESYASVMERLEKLTVKELESELEDRGIDPVMLTGTGKNGRVQRSDLLAALSEYEFERLGVVQEGA